MAFTDAQKQLLGNDLDARHVKTRDGLSYVEGWHILAEANRIFGFDAWSSETVMLNVVSAGARKIGKPGDPRRPQRDGHGVSYIAKVRVTVGDIVREGVGAGHGINLDLGQAHESAIKEAETDARKRAFMQFGNRFGLALYDKTKENVSHGADDHDEEPLPTGKVADLIPTVQPMGSRETAKAAPLADPAGTPKADSQEEHDPITGELPPLPESYPDKDEPPPPIDIDDEIPDGDATKFVVTKESSQMYRNQLLGAMNDVRKAKAGADRDGKRGYYAELRKNHWQFLTEDDQQFMVDSEQSLASKIGKKRTTKPTENVNAAA